ncbi:Gamma-tubulin complex component 4 like protein [Argiope bruennichi]|uniref:Gamma-tubulin complex component n=1 Tax=Argiope bruennichi TaxID=94029 RepID=A0A8T0E0E8_ARGBR|nr:Gamma-tubulin complex component 4 like protein [Argiope bruennichi]
MFQELLIALNGLPGSIFFDSPDGIKISSCIPNLHPAERQILERLCSLGTKYKSLCEFVKKHKFRTITSENGISGLYLQAFCSGLEVVLGEYQQELVQIEQEILKDAFLPLTHFLKLEKYTLLFQNFQPCAFPAYYRQVFYWMMNGYIEDPYKEFFIQPENSPKPNPPLSIPGSSCEKNSTSITYKVKPELLPSYIPSSLAAKILFVGEYVAVLGTAENSESYSLFLKKEHLFAKKFERLSSKPLFSLLSFETTIDDIRRCAAEVRNRYNMIFRFLLSVRRVQIDLHKCWALQMQIKGAGAESRLMPFWQLRSHMSFLIDNFQYYILVDVLESCFSSLMDKLETVKDFEEIQQYHNRFLTSVISQCFLELWTVHHSLEEILELCSSFCSLVNRVTVTMNPKDINMFDNIKSNFQRQTSLLFRILSGVRSHQVSPHLAQLLLRIDYNKYLTSCGGQLGGSK